MTGTKKRVSDEVRGSPTSYQILYTATDMHNAIKHVLGSPEPDERRVVIVAYLGRAAESFIPNPMGLEVVCALEAGATCPQSIDQLRKRGADVRQADRLHMKVYWSSIKGCVISSANASGNALGRSGLKEAGVLLPPDSVSIERLLKEANPRLISDADLRALRRSTDERDAALGPQRGSTKRPPINFVDWYESDGRINWKMGWWEEGDLVTSRAAKEETWKSYGQKEPEEVLAISKGGASKGDWLLCFKVPDGSDLEWMHVDAVVSVSPDDAAYDKQHPFQAIQVKSLKAHPTPPFILDKKLRHSFRSAIETFGTDRLVRDTSALPPKALLKLILDAMN